MNNQNPYCGSGGGGGGGFMNSPSASQGSPGGEGKRFASQSLRPVVIRQILDSQDSSESNDLVIDGVEANQLTVVAQVLYVQIQATNLVMHLDDGTGQLESRQWVGAGTDMDDIRVSQGVEENQWIRIIGTIKSFSNKRHLAAQHIRPVKDPHEVYFALLEAMSVHLHFTRGAPGAPQVAGGQSNSAYSSASQAAGPPQDNYASFPALERKIMHFILNSAPGDEGIHVASISKGLGNVNAADVSDAIERLTENGHIYNTIDEFHYNVSI